MNVEELFVEALKTSDDWPEPFSIDIRSVSYLARRKTRAEQEGMLDLIYHTNFPIFKELVYCAQPMTPAVPGPLSRKGRWIDRLQSVEYEDDTFNCHLLDTRARWMNYRYYGPISEVESIDGVRQMVIHTDLAIIHACSVVLLDATKAFSFGATTECVFARLFEIPVVAVVADKDEASPWLKHFCSHVVTEAQIDWHFIQSCIVD